MVAEASAAVAARVKEAAAGVKEAAAVVKAAVAGTVAAAVPTCTRYHWCKSCSGRGPDTGSCWLCLCCIASAVWAALAGLCH